MNVFKRLFRPFLEEKIEKEEKTDTGYYEMDEETKAFISLFAKYIAVDYVATCLSRVPIKTIQNGKENQGDLFYLLNYCPNRSQNASDFFYEFWFRYLWDGEVLAFEHHKEWFVADHFCASTKNTAELYFESVNYGDFSLSKCYYSDVIYIGDPWESSHSDAMLNSVLSYCNEILSITTKIYSKASNEKYFLEVGALPTGDDYEEKFKKMMNVSFKNFLKSDKAVLPLIGGITAKSANDSTKSQGNKSIITEIKDTISLAIETAARKYRIPPALLTGGSSGLSEVLDLFIGECICYYTDKADKEFSRKLYRKEEILHGSKILFDTSMIKYSDLFSCASGADKLKAAAICSTNEIRRALKLQNLDKEWADGYTLTKNYSTLSDAEGDGQDE